MLCWKYFQDINGISTNKIKYFDWKLIDGKNNAIKWSIDT